MTRGCCGDKMVCISVCECVYGNYYCCSGNSKTFCAPTSIKALAEDVQDVVACSSIAALVERFYPV